MRITDRVKDVIKSGGEWISSIDLESAAMAHPQVALAASIGVPHPKWAERPYLYIVRRPGTAIDTGEMRAFFSSSASPGGAGRYRVRRRNADRCDRQGPEADIAQALYRAVQSRREVCTGVALKLSDLPRRIALAFPDCSSICPERIDRMLQRQPGNTQAAVSRSWALVEFASIRADQGTRFRSGICHFPLRMSSFGWYMRRMT
ncbi:AMP-binding enzyme [Paraburkholderia sp. BL27I4N3]|nr:AMP-binding enzyme [Paraburkholderia sp. BL27I4N3]